MNWKAFSMANNEISPENMVDLRPLSPMQEGMLYHSLREPESAAYIEQCAFAIRGSLDPAALEEAWNLLAARHDALRTVFVPEKASQPLPMILRQRRLRIRFERIQSESEFEDYRRADRSLRFDLKSDLLLRVALFQMGDQDYRLVWTNHHIILDGWSGGILMRELFQLYEAVSTGRKLVLSEPVSNREYLRWLGARNVDAASAWWASELEDYEDSCDLPAGPGAEGTGELRRHVLDLDEHATAALSECAAAAKATVSTLLLCAWGILLARANHRSDVVFGVTVSGRPVELAGAGEMVGLFINTVPVRVRSSWDESVRDLLGRVQSRMLEGEPFHFLSLAEIQSQSACGAGLITHLLTYENYPGAASDSGNRSFRIAGLEIEPLEGHEQTNYPLAIAVVPGPRLRFSFRFIDDIYSPEQIRETADALRTMLEAMAPDTPLRGLPLLSPAARAMLETVHGPKVELPNHQCVIPLFEHQVRASGERTALLADGVKLTYAQLERKSSGLARALRNAVDMRPEEPVAVCLEPSTELIIAILAVLKAGGAYVPVDPSGPPERNAKMFRQLAARVAIAGLEVDLPEGLLRIDPTCFAESQGSELGVSYLPETLAYVLFTSGSTGEPKGVAIEQHSIVNLIFAGIRPLWRELGDSLRIGLLAAPVFDASVQQIFGALLCGHTLVVASNRTKEDPSLLLDWLERHRVDVCDGTPTRFALLLEAGLLDRPAICVRRWMLGGEALPTALLRRYWSSPESRSVSIGNLYGPTECCVDNTASFLTPETIDPMAVASIGRPLGNQRVYVMDGNLEPLPLYFKGELCVAGPGVGRGYWQMPELTRQRFVNRPQSGERLYRTGDLGRRLSDGRIEWLGREDSQVKLRGFRVDLGEIESALLSHDDIEQAAAGVVDGDLVAWYGERRPSPIAALRSYLEARLPGHMVPSVFIPLESLPLNRSGKLDRARLPMPDRRIPEDAGISADSAENAVRAVWQEVLGASLPEDDQDFFAAGGHSLKAMRVITLIRKRLGVALELAEFFEEPTIAGLAARLAARNPGRFAHIESIPEGTDYETSHAQRRVWFLSRLEAGSAYNMPAALEIRGGLNPAALRAALRDVMDRHEVLRSKLVLVGDELRQVPLENAAAEFSELDFSRLAEPEAELMAALRAEAKRNFDLGVEPPIRALLVRCGPDRWKLLLTVHHLAADGISIGVLAHDLLFAYRARCNGDEPGFPPLRLQYRDFSAWQNRLLRSAAGESHRLYWHDRLAGEIAALNLPSDRQRPPLQSFEGDQLRTIVPRTLAEDLRSFARGRNASLFSVLVAAVKALLHRYTGERDIVVGTPVSGRFHPDLESQVGCYINTVVLRDEVRSALPWEELFESVRRTVREALEHQIYPFDRLCGELNLPVDAGRNPVFDVMVILQPPAPPLDAPPGLTVHSIDLRRGASKFDATFEFSEDADGSISVVLEYSSALFDTPRIQRMANHFLRLLASTTADCRQSIGLAPMLSEAERRLLTVTFNVDGGAPLPQEYSVPAWFAASVAVGAERPAVHDADGYLTWRELDYHSSMLARRLMACGVRRGEVVGLSLKRSRWLVVAELAVLRAGAAFLPLSSSMPDERGRLVAADSSLKVLLCDLARTPGWAEGLMRVDPSAPWDSPLDGQWELPRVGSEDLAYLLYTSGSTGKPKGVAVEHRALAAFATNLTRRFRFREGEMIYAATAPTFDISILELICAPLCGIAVYVAGDESLEDPARTVLDIEHSGASLFQCTPSRLELLLKQSGDGFLRSIRVLLVGGEVFSAQLASRLTELPGLEIWNVYGPTETCIWSTSHPISDPGGQCAPPIGVPLAGERIYIVSEDLEIQPVGVAGEIAIGGAGLARGYVNDSELTSRRFVSLSAVDGERVYLTGDLGRWNESGEIEYFGRKDFQIKLRGQRIEPGEVEWHIRNYPGVDSAVVVVRKVHGASELVGYLVAGRPVDVPSLRNYLRRFLPAYMVPSYVCVVEALPLNSSGKINLLALPAPEDPSEPAKRESPRSALEFRVARIFEEVLGRESFGRDENFFEQGGQSLKAMMAIARLRREVASGLSLADIFAAPTVAELAARAAVATASAPRPIGPVAGSEDRYPLSYAQRRLWLLEQMNPESAAYNMTAAFLLEGTLDPAIVRAALRSLVQRHEILRTGFALDSGEPRQFIFPESDCLSLVNLEDLSDAESRVDVLLTSEGRQRFDLLRGPVFRAALYRLDGRRAVLAFHMHHIVSDGWSIRVLIDDLIAFYRFHQGEVSVGPTPLELQYKDYAAWQQEPQFVETLEAQRRYWHGQLASPRPVLDLPCDIARPLLQTFTGSRRSFSIAAADAAAFRRLARTCSAGMFMSWTALVKALLFRYAGQDEIIVGTPVAGREHAVLERLAGVFVNTLALRNTVKGDENFVDLLTAVRRTVIGALENQTYPFDLLVEELVRNRDTSRSAFFDVVVTAGSEDAPAIEHPGIVARPWRISQPISKFDLSFEFTEKPDGSVECEIEYNRDLFLPGRIERMETHLRTLLSSVIASPRLPLTDLELLTQTERRLVIQGFNPSLCEYEPVATVTDLFETQATLRPGAVAVQCDRRTWTYAEMNCGANGIAAFLLQHGCGPGDIIAVYARPSDWMMAAILGIHKAGAAYLPLDPAYPVERVQLLLQTSRCRAVLLEPGRELRPDAVPVWDISGLMGGDAANPARRHGGRDLAYVIFTSGSSGEPKGVLIEHAGLFNLVSHYCRKLQMTCEDRTTVLASVAFDSSVAEYWPALCSGASLRFTPDSARESPSRLARWIASEGLTIANFPTSLGELFLRSDLPHALRLRHVLVGGEQLRSLPGLEYPFHLINSYGPTESTVDACWAWLDMEAYTAPNPPIGGPLGNVRLYVLDANDRPVPFGIPGELCIAGASLARGYLDRPDLTAAKFVPDPFQENGARMYRSGDRARRREDGKLEYLGRLDSQLKIRGYRIEPGEIEACLLKHPSVRAAAVDSVQIGAALELAAWVVFHESGEKTDPALLQAFLRERLPEFMVPAVVVPLTELPLTSNGKIDRPCLPRPAGISPDSEQAVPPRTILESAIAAVWQLVLGARDFGVFDDFFAVGGHSLKAMQLSGRLFESLNVEVTLPEIFLNPTIAALAELVSARRGEPLKKIGPAPLQADYPVSHAQRRLWLLDRMTGPSPQYNMPGYYVIHHAVREDVLADVFTRLIARHEVLRTRLIVRDGEPRQVVDPPWKMELPVIDLRHDEDGEAKARSFAEADLNQPFDLARDYPIRCRLLRLRDARCVLLLTLHHIAGDGWSMQLLYEELQEMYSALAENRAPELSALKLQYRDYACWEHETGFSRSESYWLDKLRGPIAPVRLPFDFDPDDSPGAAGESREVTLSPEVSSALRELAVASGSTLANVLLTMFVLLLNRLTEQDELAIAMSAANRARPELQNMVGFFVNEVVLRVGVGEDKPFSALLADVTAIAAEAFTHQDYPLDLLIQKLNPQRIGGRQPLFNVVYAFQGFTDLVIGANSKRSRSLDIASALPVPIKTSKFDLTLFVIDSAGPEWNSIQLVFEYGTSVLRAETVEKWLQILRRFCETVAREAAELGMAQS
jgi:amino acid adenylation domain-containing protein